MPKLNLHCVLLAAGQSSRYGSPKQLVKINGRCLVTRSFDILASVFGCNISVVVGANAEAVTAQLEGIPQIVENPIWDHGIGASIAAGVNALPDNCDAVVIALADQIAIKADHFAELVELHVSEPDLIHCAEYGGSVGAPVVFPKSYFEQLAKLDSDQGAKHIIEQVMAQDATQVSKLVMPAAALDIDTPSQLQSWLEEEID